MVPLSGWSQMCLSSSARRARVSAAFSPSLLGMASRHLTIYAQESTWLTSQSPLPHQVAQPPTLQPWKALLTLPSLTAYAAPGTLPVTPPSCTLTCPPASMSGAKPQRRGPARVPGSPAAASRQVFLLLLFPPHPFSTAGENGNFETFQTKSRAKIKWCSCFRKQSESSSKDGT